MLIDKQSLLAAFQGAIEKAEGEVKKAMENRAWDAVSQLDGLVQGLKEGCKIIESQADSSIAGVLHLVRARSGGESSGPENR